MLTPVDTGRSWGWQEAVSVLRPGQHGVLGPLPKNSEALLPCISIKQQAGSLTGQENGSKEAAAKERQLYSPAQKPQRARPKPSPLRTACMDGWSPDTVSAASLKLGCRDPIRPHGAHRIPLPRCCIPSPNILEPPTSYLRANCSETFLWTTPGAQTLPVLLHLTLTNKQLP